MNSTPFTIFSTFRVVLGVLIFSLLMTSCKKDDEPAALPAPSTTSSDIVAIPFFVETDANTLPAQASDLLYENRLHEPLMAPDGHQVTWGEFSAVTGSVQVQCTDAGNRVTLNFQNLIPNGVYTVWNVSVDAPGFDPSVAGMNISGIGAAGKGDGSDNVFIASPMGTGGITTVSPGGALSLFGEVSDCPITDQFEWHVVITYHIDSKSHGTQIGPDGTFAEQAGFIFRSGTN